MCLLYPLTSIEHGYISLNGLAVLLAGGCNTYPAFPRLLSEVREYYSRESENLYWVDPDDDRRSKINLEEARNFCVLKEYVIPTRIKAPETIAEFKVKVNSLEKALAEVNDELVLTKSKLTDEEPVSALRALGALAMLLARDVENDSVLIYQTKNELSIKPAVNPIAEGVIDLIENKLGKNSKNFSNATMRKIINAGIAAFNQQLYENGNK